MKALLSLLGSLTFTSIWAKVKIALLVSAISFMVWQGWQMNSLQQDVTKLETVQSSLQLQVQQMSADYNMLRDNYKNSARTSLQYLESVNQLNGKSTELEKSFSALEVKAANASQKADRALSLQTGTAPRVSNETSSKQAHKSLGRDTGNGAGGSDAEWRELLDKTYCSVYPTDSKCT